MQPIQNGYPTLFNNIVTDSPWQRQNFGHRSSLSLSNLDTQPIDIAPVSLWPIKTFGADQCAAYLDWIPNLINIVSVSSWPRQNFGSGSLCSLSRMGFQFAQSSIHDMKFLHTPDFLPAKPKVWGLIKPQCTKCMTCIFQSLSVRGRHI